MEDKRFVCRYPQYSFCGNRHCPLAKYCIRFPVLNLNFAKFRDIIFKGNQIRKTEREVNEHQNKYNLYNCMFGDLKNKRRIYNKKYYEQNRERILREKRKDSSKVSVLQNCEYDCFSCPYDDCIIPEYSDRKEYMDLYYKKNHEKLLEQKSLYRSLHRKQLTNSEKLRNYRSKGYDIISCTYLHTTDIKTKSLENTKGCITEVKINGKDYFSFISDDRQASFRVKISRKTNQDRIVKYETNDSNEYIFNLHI